MKTYLLVILILFSNLSFSQNFIEYSNNPVIDTLGTTNPSEVWTRWKTDPFVIQLGGDTLRMYYGTNNFGVATQIGTAISLDGNFWTEKRDTAIVSLGGTGTWDEETVETPGVIYVPNNPDSMKYMLYYTGGTYDTSILDTTNIGLFPIVMLQMGMAYSKDGINFTKYNNPSNDSNPLYAESDPILTIPYTTGAFPDTIDYSFSSIGEPSPMYDSIAGKFKMWYIGFGCGNPTCAGTGALRHRILYTESNDGINWSPSTLVLDIGTAGEFDATQVYAPHVIKIGNQYWMIYSGHQISNSSNFCLFSMDLGLATSNDGINFNKSTSNPIIPKGTTGSWNNLGSNYPGLVVYKDTLRVYYSGMQDSSVNFIPQIGYSYLDSNLAVSINNVENKNYEYTIYPNPANKYISIRLPNKNIKEITLINLLGKVILTKENISSPITKISTKNIKAGSYFLKIRSIENELFSQKIIIIH